LWDSANNADNINNRFCHGRRRDDLMRRKKTNIIMVKPVEPTRIIDESSIPLGNSQIIGYSMSVHPSVIYVSQQGQIIHRFIYSTDSLDSIRFIHSSSPLGIEIQCARAPIIRRKASRGRGMFNSKNYFSDLAVPSPVTRRTFPATNHTSAYGQRRVRSGTLQ
jgi:hypothetical protein